MHFLIFTEREGTGRAVQRQRQKARNIRSDGKLRTGTARHGFFRQNNLNGSGQRTACTGKQKRGSEQRG